MTVEQMQIRLSNVLMVVIVILMVFGGGLAMLIAKQLSVTPSDVYREVRSLRDDLHRSEAEANAIYSAIEQTGSAVVVLNDQGIVTVWSAGAEELFRVRREEAVGFGIAHIVPDGMRESHRKLFDAAVHGRDRPFQNTVECNAKRSDGTLVPVRISIWGVPEHRVVAIFSDLSRSK